MLFSAAPASFIEFLRRSHHHSPIRFSIDMKDFFDKEGMPSTAIDSFSGAFLPPVAPILLPSYTPSNGHHSCLALLMMWRTETFYDNQHNEKKEPIIVQHDSAHQLKLWPGYLKVYYPCIVGSWQHVG